MKRIRLFLVFGTRPEAIKMAPIIKECLRRKDVVEIVVCFTGQHRELASDVINYFDLRIDRDLAIMRPNQSLPDLTSRCLSQLHAAIAEHTPDYVVAQGDTTTAMVAALASFYEKRPFVHIEAGLRTYNLQSPWPEELNRRIATLVASVHCAPTQWAADNLLAEHVQRDLIHITGNTVVDALLWSVDRERANDGHWRRKYGQIGNGPMVLVTSHRRENFGTGLEQICSAVRSLARQLPNVVFVFPVHLNPNVQETVQRMLAAQENVYLLAPVPYPEFVWLMDQSSLILTDSGGIQEEAPSLGKPVLVMRDTTERPEGITAGVAELIGTRTDAIVSRASQILNDIGSQCYGNGRVNPYGDGKAAGRIVDLLLP